MRPPLPGIPFLQNASNVRYAQTILTPLQESQSERRLSSSKNRGIGAKSRKRPKKGDKKGLAKLIDRLLDLDWDFILRLVEWLIDLFFWVPFGNGDIDLVVDEHSGEVAVVALVSEDLTAH